MKINYYEFQEILDIYPAQAPDHPHDKNLSATWFTDMLSASDLKVNVNLLDSSITDATITAILNYLMTIIYERHHADFLYKVITSWNETYSLDTDDFKIAMNKVLNVLELTIPRYIPIFIQNKVYSANPVAKISSTNMSRTRFNDTPQDEGEYNDEEHATNVSRTISESEVDSGSIMERLDAMFKGFRSIILEWSNEFNQLFLKEEQIYE